MTMEKMARKEKKETSRPIAAFSAEQKCTAVLSIWTERRTATEICRELSIPWMVALSQWQKRAMEGMLQALEPRVNLDKGAVLSPRLQAMLTKRLLTVGEGKLQSRLAKVQGVKTEKKDEPVLKDEKKP